MRKYGAKKHYPRGNAIYMGNGYFSKYGLATTEKIYAAIYTISMMMYLSMVPQ
ncbi:hypothetical protein [Zobellia alginiliquefaciens]|uniref:hypothetical protein n=1 Tax=Zobellia alginiliquefaciens TaxID=3032586 RepID=UPI0023E45408|nr:hypothetical protein [Zobellia alginiliquefaciens]